MLINRTKKLIVLSLLLGGLWQISPLPALADHADPTYDVITVSGTGRDGQSKDMFNLYFMKDSSPSVKPGTFPKFTPIIKQCLTESASYWADMLAPGSANTQGLALKLTTLKKENASGGPDTFKDTVNIPAEYRNENIPLKALQNDFPSGYSSDENNFAGVYELGYLGTRIDPTNNFSAWYINSATQIPDSASFLQADLAGCTRHEFGHILGIVASTISPNLGFTYNFVTTKLNPYTNLLRDAYGNKPQTGMEVIAKENQIPAGAKHEDYFILGATSGNFSGKAYITGENIDIVRNGATFLDSPGIPVVGQDLSKVDLSHLQLRGNLMSHERYCNYSTFMEIELAVLQDMGYRLDRRNYFGYSIYNDGMTLTNTNPYYARNTEGTDYIAGTYNTTRLGLGLHIYGSNNTVTQAADILSIGTGAIGVRMDGCGNSLTVQEGTRVHANGTDGTGIWVAYGSAQQVNLDGEVLALGNKGIGARFDFGSSSNGSKDEYRGSYMLWHESTTIDDPVVYPTNPKVELAGPQVTDFNINGTLAGTKNAIYIGSNALVSKINVNTGAKLQGAITSDWMSQTMIDAWAPSFAIDREKNDLRLTFSGDTETLATNLNFQGNDLTYAGNVSGANNMRFNVLSGDLKYSGIADVIKATVASGATLAVNGTFNLNKDAKTMALYDATTGAVNDAGVAFTGAGTFLNQGTIIPMATSNIANDSFTINGNFVNQGKIGLAVDKQGSRTIAVSGTAELSAESQVVAVAGSSYLPTTYNLITAGTVTSNMANNQAFTGMLSLDSAVSGDNSTLLVTLNKANNMGSLNSQETETYNAMNAMVDVLPTGEKNSMSTLYALPPSQAKIALNQIKGNNITALPYVTARQNWIGGSVEKSVASQTAPHTNEEKGRYRIWADYSHMWDNPLGFTGKQNNMVLGADKEYRPGSRLGFYTGYGQSNYTGDNTRLDDRDFRLGLYHWQQNGQWDYLTQLNYGRQNTDTTRYLNALDLKAEGGTKSDVLFLGLKARKNTKRMGQWNCNPYFTGDITFYSQKSYQEHGAGPYNHQVDHMSAVYTTLGAGVEVERSLSNISWGGKLGYRRVLSGNNPDLTYSYAGLPGKSYYEDNEDIGKNYLVAGVKLDYRMSKQSFLQLSADWQHAIGHTVKALGLNYTYKF